MDVIFTILAANITAALGQLFFKIGMGDVGSVDGLDIQKLIQMFTNPMVIVGLAAFGISTIFWLTALSRKDLSFVYPFFAINVVLVFILSAFVLHENITVMRIVGAGIILLGIVFISRT